ncbi:hypothetical protein DMS26_23305 [Klebsiella variicola]|nr:hypothetical protein DMS26_23305 [Klebsiella variicola]
MGNKNHVKRVRVIPLQDIADVFQNLRITGLFLLFCDVLPFLTQNDSPLQVLLHIQFRQVAPGLRINCFRFKSHLTNDSVHQCPANRYQNLYNVTGQLSPDNGEKLSASRGTG